MKNKQDDYHFEYNENVKLEDVLILSDGKSKDAYSKQKMNPLKFFGIFIKNNDEKILGGVTCYTYYGCLHIDTLFVNEDLRGLGFGKKLVMDAEKIGQKNGAFFATVNTMDFEAPVFYEKLGYEIEFIREGFQNGNKMYLLRKNLH